MGGMQRLLLQNGTLMQRWNYNEQGQTQLLGMYKTPSGGPNETLMKLTLGYGTATENNGNVRSQAITVGSFAASQSYDYDRWSRLKVAQEGSNWRQEFGYDRWGNRWMVTAGTSGIPIPAGTPSGTALDAGNWFSPATNRIVYSEDSGANPPNPKTDKAGNQSFDGDWRNRYDVENRIARVELPGTPVTVAGAYEYDGEGRRVKKTVGTASTTYVYDATGQMMQEVQVGGTATAAGRSYLFQDHLGSTRLRVDASGVRQGWWDYAPFGEVVPATLGNRNSVPGGAYEGPRPKMMFTGKERDAESGLDYFGARYTSSAHGRFTSPDPVMSAPERLRDPQQFNRYAYARNNPLRFVDPTGERLQLSGDADEAQKQLCEILGTSDCSSRISYDSKTNTITVDFAGIDFAKNEGASLLNNLIGSSNLYDLTIGSEYMTAGGKQSLNDAVANLNNAPDPVQYRSGRPESRRPAAGIDGLVAINPAIAAQYKDSQGRRVPLWATIFHELAEAYGKVDLGKIYTDMESWSVNNGMITVRPHVIEQGAHNYSVDREIKLRNQRPNTRLSGRAGDQLIRDPK